LIFTDSSSGIIFASSWAPKTDVLLPIIKSPVKNTTKMDALNTESDR